MKKPIHFALNNIDVVSGRCDNCQETSILISIISDYYRCTNCGHDMKQYVNGSIKYLPLSHEEKEWLRNQNSE